MRRRMKKKKKILLPETQLMMLMMMMMIDILTSQSESESLYQISDLPDFILIDFFLLACNFSSRVLLQIVLVGGAPGRMAPALCFAPTAWAWPLHLKRGILSTDRNQRAILAFDSYERFFIEVHSKGVNMELVEKLLLDQQKRFGGQQPTFKLLNQ